MAYCAAESGSPCSGTDDMSGTSIRGRENTQHILGAGKLASPRHSEVNRVLGRYEHVVTGVAGPATTGDVEQNLGVARPPAGFGGRAQRRQCDPRRGLDVD